MKVILVFADGEVKVINPEQLDFADHKAESSCFFVPDSLRLSNEQQAQFDRAIKAGLMERLADGRYHWLASKALLAYFCGRVFCGDSPMEGHNGKTVWKFGGENFPKSAVERLFGTNGIADY